jgi:hypothetical protein
MPYRHRTVALLAAVLPLVALAPARADDALERGFQTPPASAKPHTWWHWLNGNVSEAGITADLEAMAAVGLGGAQIFNVDQGVPAGDTPFFSPQWRKAVVHAVREAKRLKIELCLHNCAGWSSSGGPWIDAAHSMQVLTWSETPVTGGRTVTATLPEPEKRAGHYADIAVIAFRTPTDNAYRIPDIGTKALFERGGNGLGTGTTTPAMARAQADATIAPGDVHVLSCAADGTLSWDAPAGNWTLLRIGHTTTGAVNAPAPDAGRGFECDKLSRAAMDLHWEKGIAPILSDLGPELAGKVLNNALIDSYEVGSQNWTPTLRAEFTRRRGYDPLPWLAVMTGRVIGSAEQSERFLWDMRRTIADLFAENYAGRFRELCHKNGMRFSVEPYGNGPFDNLQVGALADIPMGEFWIGGAAAETLKIAASAAHVTGKKIVGAESFTADDIRGRWLVDPYATKAIGDRMFAQGLNRVIFHRYAHQPWTNLEPGMTMGPWGTHFERTVTWWNQSRDWLTYIARCQFLLQQGQPVADVLTFCGDGAPADLLRPSLPAGFDYDGCDRTVLQRLRVDNGQIVAPGGARYRVLLLPDSDTMTVETLQALVRLARAGATVVGRTPSKSPSLSGYPASDATVARLAATLKLTPPERLGALLGTPDVRVDGGELPWIHRRTGETDLYFVSNPASTNRTVRLRLRVADRAPELWYAESGHREPAPEWSRQGGGTDVTLRLGPAESVFVVLRPAAAERTHLVRIERNGGPADAAIAAPVVTIESAFYEAVDGAGGREVTALVRQRVARGETEVPATNALFGDPVVNHVKRLRVIFSVNGKRQERTAPENDAIDLVGGGSDTRLPEFEVRGGRLRAFTAGRYTLTDDRGQTVTRTLEPPIAQPLTRPWTLAFPAGRGAPPSVTLPTLASWTEHTDPRVRYFSGTATYTTTFTVDGALRARDRALMLDLGRVKNIAEVAVNGKPLPTLWKAPWRTDITRLVRTGENTLTVRVTNLWVNRLIGDEQLPPEVEWAGAVGPIARFPQWLVDGKPRPHTERVAFSTWRFWGKDAPLLESGLIGPVVLHAVPTVAVQER